MPDKWEPFIKINYAYPEGADPVNAMVEAQIRPARRRSSPRAPDARRGRAAHAGA